MTNPNGSLIELCEQDTRSGDRKLVARPCSLSRSGRRSRIRTKTKQLFADITGLLVSPNTIRDAAHEAHRACQPEVVTLTDGRSFLELASYQQTRDWRAGYRIRAEGISNIGLDSDTSPARSEARWTVQIKNVDQYTTALEQWEAMK